MQAMMERPVMCYSTRRLINNAFPAALTDDNLKARYEPTT